MAQENKISFTVNNIPAKRNHALDGMIALKKIQHFSYALSDEIGLGYSSHVYKGKNDKTNELVAVKVIDIKKQDDLHKQFTNNQVNILQKIKNASPQHLLRLQGVYKTKNNLYIITEFCQGKDIAKILRKKKIFPQSQAQGIMKQFLKGYKQLYNLKIVHRDLKLANIFIRKGRAVLADLGFAIQAQKCVDKFDYNVGSPFYMPPQALKLNRYSYKSDVWAIGIIAFELIFGHRPWKDKDDDILFDKIKSTKIDELFENNVNVSEHYKNFIRACLQVDFDRRASPQYVINYEWPQANDYIDGLEDNTYHHPKAVSISKLPHNIHPVSAKHVGYKVIQFDEIKQNKDLKAHNFEQPNFILAERQNSPGKPILQNRKKNLSLPEGPESRKQIKYQQERIQQPYQYESLLKKRNQRQNSVEYPQKQVFGQRDVQKTLLSQIQYCRFLNLVWDEIQSSGFDQFYTLSMQISKKILEKIDFLSNLEIQQENEFISGLRAYIAGSRWKILHEMILEYKQKYTKKFQNIMISQNQPLTLESISNAVSYLKNRVQEHERLVQLLIYLYQVEQIDSTRNIVQFSKESKIEYLAQNRSTVRNSNTIDRLSKKIQYLDF